MLAFVQGKIAEIGTHHLTVQVGGFGVSLQVPHPEIYQNEQEIKLVTHLHWTQENGPVLFGFSCELEKTVFLLVTSCSGMGPKIGMALLAGMSPLEFLQAVQEGNEKALSSITGIGPKKAEAMVMQLRSKVAKVIQTGLPEVETKNSSLGHWKDLVQVFQSLHYTRGEVDAALMYLRKEHAGSAHSFDELIRHGLSFLSRKV